MTQEAEAEHYKTPEAPMARGAEGASAEVLKELAHIKSIATRAWTYSQQGSVKKRNLSPKTSEDLVMDVEVKVMLSKSAPTLEEVFKLQGGEPEETEENDSPHTRNKRKILTNSRKRALLGDGQEQD